MVSKNQLWIYARDGFKNVCNHVFMSFSSVFTLIITLSICAALIMFVENTQHFTREIEAQVTIFAEFHENVTDEQINEVKVAIAAHPLITNFEFSDREQERQLQIYLLAGDDDALAYFLQGIDEDRIPVVDVLNIEVASIEVLEEVSDFVYGLGPIQHTEHPAESANLISDTTVAIRNFMLVFVAALMLLSIFLIQNTIRMTIFSRKEELEIMRLVGASIPHITLPFVVEGLIIGIIGSIVPILFTMIGYRIMYTTTSGIFAVAFFQLLSPVPLVYNVGFTMGLISIGVSLLGSLLAVLRYTIKD